MPKIIFFRSIFGWHIVFEQMGYKSRVEYRLRIWRTPKRRTRRKAK